MKIYSKILNIIEKIITSLLGAFLVVMVFAIGLQIVLRALGKANVWSEELARYLFAWLVLLGGCVAIRKNSHLQVDFFTNMMKPKLCALVQAICMIVGMVFLVFLCATSLPLIANTFTNTSAGLRIPMAYIYMCIPAGSALMVLFGAEYVYTALKKGFADKEEKINVKLLALLIAIIMAILLFPFVIPNINPGLVCIILLVALSLYGVPIFYSLGIGTLVALYLVKMTFVVLPQKMFVGLDSVALLAIPFFVLAGNLMSRTITQKLIGVANALIGWVRGSLGVVCIVACALFGAITGSAVATLSAIGGILIPAMIKEKYPDHFASALGSTSSILGPLIPPSITLIVYGSITETSVASLFKASVIPGIIFAIALVGYMLFYAKKHDLPKHEKMPPKEIAKALKDGVWALLMPVIILGGIFGGIFTATEAAVVAVIYALLISLFVYKDLKWKEILPEFGVAGIATAAMVLLVGTSKSTSYVIVTSGLPQSILGAFTAITDSPVVFLLLINALFLIIGMIMEANSAIVMMTPLLMPLVSSYGINPIHFGMIMSFNLYIGLMTPPVGVSILLGNTIAGSRLSQTIKSALPMLAIALVMLLLVTYVPALTTWLPSLGK